MPLSVLLLIVLSLFHLYTKKKGECRDGRETIGRSDTTGKGESTRDLEIPSFWYVNKVLAIDRTLQVYYPDIGLLGKLEEDHQLGSLKGSRLLVKAVVDYRV